MMIPLMIKSINPVILIINILRTTVLLQPLSC